MYKYRIKALAGTLSGSDMFKGLFSRVVSPI